MEELTMTNTDITKLITRKQIAEHLEKERQEWLSAGMNEADIFLIHFGEESENGRGGDYRIWLDERKHTRSDRKYSPGTPISINELDQDRAFIKTWRNDFEDIEFSIDMEMALSKLSTAQRELVIAVFVDGATPAEYSRDKGINKSVVSRTLARAKENLKNFFIESN